MGILYGHLPGQEYLGAVLVGREEVRHTESAAAALNDGVRLGRIEDHNRTSVDWDSMTRRREVQVQTDVLTQEEIAKRHTAIEIAVMNIGRSLLLLAKISASSRSIPLSIN